MSFTRSRHAQTFRTAAAIIEQQPKLSRKYLHDCDGNYCTMGAVLKVLDIDTYQAWTEEMEDLPEIRSLALALDEFYPRFKCVSNWNDKLGRSPAEAAGFLRQAADFLDEWYHVYRM